MRPIRAMLGLVLTLALLPLVAATPARASTLVTTPPLWETNGTVNTALVAGTTLYIGGDFTRVGLATGSFAALDATSGSRDATFPTVNGPVRAIIPDGSGGWYIGGDFSQVGGLPRTDLARIRADKSVDPNWAPNTSYSFTGPIASVNALVLSAGVVYVGGSFNFVNGNTVRSSLAALDATSGAVTGWDPNVSGTVNALALDGTTLYVGGFFSQLNFPPINRSNLAAVNTTTGVATAFDPIVDSTVNALAVGGGIVYAGGFFAQVNNPQVPRNGLAAFDGTTGAVVAGFNPNLSVGGAFAGSAFALALSGTTLYAGGIFSDVNGGTLRSNLAAFDTATGTATAFNPNVGGNVTSLALNGGNVYVGGTFSSIGTPTAQRSNLAVVDATSGTVAAWDPGPSGTVQALAVSGNTVFAGGSFRFLGGTPRSSLAALDLTTGAATSWNPNVSSTFGFDQVNALALDGSTIYAGGSFDRVNGSTIRNNLAAFDAATGTVVATFNPDPNGSVNALVMSGTTLYVGGAFNRVGNDFRNNLAALNTADGTPTSFDPNVRITGCVNCFQGSVNALALGGSILFAGGSFNTVNSATIRNNLAAVNTGDGVATAFDPNLNGIVSALALSGTTLYAGGIFTQVNSPAVTRNNLAAFDTTSGAAAVWNPNASFGGFGGNVNALALSGSILFAGGSFSQVNNTNPATSRNNLAAFDATPTNAAATAAVWNPDVGGFSVNALALGGPFVYAGGSFNSVGETPRSYLAPINAGPVVITGAASNVTATGATLAGTVSTFSFDATTTGFALTTTSGNYTNPILVAATPASVTGTTTQVISGNATGLTANTTYYYGAGTTSVMGIFNGAELSFTTKPAIGTQPVASTINSGKTATLSVVVPGTATLSYQWYEGAAGDTSQPVANGTGASLTTPALSKTTSYWVRVTNLSGSVDSSAATVTVIGGVYLPLVAK